MFCFCANDRLLHIVNWTHHGSVYAKAMIREGKISVIRSQVGLRIRELRTEQGLSQYKFSEMIGMDRTYLIGVEKGRRNISLDNLIKISVGLDVHLSELFEGVDVEMQDKGELQRLTV